MKNSMKVLLTGMLLLTVFACSDDVVPSDHLELNVEPISIDVDTQETETDERPPDEGEDIGR